MYQTYSLLFLYSERPLHPGGNTSIGHVDQPIQREVYTQLPLIRDSSVKGATRHDMAEAQDIPEKEDRIKELEGIPEAKRSDEQQRELEDKKEEIAPFEAVFGPNVGTGREHEHGGALGFSDARILLFPVPSLSGLFGWVTCPFVLDRLRRDLSKVVPETAPNANGTSSTEPALPDVLGALDALLEMPMPEVSEAWASSSSTARVQNGGQDGGDVITLEDLTYSSPKNERSPHTETVGQWLGAHALPEASAYDHMRRRLPNSLIVVADEVFRDFTRFSTEVATRIRIGETGTVVEGALWNEELLPSNCLLYSLTPATRSLSNNTKDDMGAEEVLGRFVDHIEENALIQFGGGRSLTRGLAQATLQTVESLRPASTEGENSSSS